MDKWLTTGRLESEIRSLYESVRGEAVADDAIWGAGSIDVGVRQLLQDWIPLRRKQLTEEYAVGGEYGLVPGPQPPSGELKVWVAGADTGEEWGQFVELRNPHPFAVDLSGWSLDGPARWWARQGTVIPAGGSLLVARSIPGVRGGGRLVVGSLDRSMSRGAGDLVLRDEGGREASRLAV